MMFLERSSPSSEQFRPTEHNFFHREQLQARSPSFKHKSSKRRLSDEFSSPKKNKIFQRNTTSPSKHEYPEFQLPGGGKVQQTPFGNMKVVHDGVKEVASIDKSINLDSFKTPHSPIPIPIVKTPKMTPRFMPSPSPSCEAESYMIEGYYLQGNINKSYHHQSEDIINFNYSLYDQHNEDGHLNSDNDCEMSL